MPQADIDDPSWYQALTLAERLATLRARGAASGAEVDAELARKRLRRWQSQPPFASGSLFEQRLALDGMSEDELLRLLGEPIEAVRARTHEAPAWLRELVEAYSQDANPAAAEAPSDAAEGIISGSFLQLAEPLIRAGRERLRVALRALVQEQPGELPFDPDTIEPALFANLPGQLLTMLNPTLALELNIARLEERLTGETPEERFADFLKGLRRPETALAILREYPLLARQLVLSIERWLGFSLEFLRHLCADWPALRSAFSTGREPGFVASVKGGAGDSHRGGRSVLIVEFDSGLRLVYKPKSMAVEGHFQQLLAWLNERGAHPGFRTVGVLDRGDYGWMEFVEAHPCASAEEVRRFYERQGGYLALLYALEATDFHYENLIAAGEHPVLIDLEPLFQPRTEGVDPAQPDGPAGTAVSYSVLRVGLLPRRIWSGEGVEDGLDISGLGSVEGQLTPHPVQFWEGAGTDRMRVGRKRVALHAGRNRPTVAGAEVNTLDYADALNEGFESVYRLLARHGDELLAGGGPLSRFAADQVRVIVRQTKTYSLLLRESFHPTLLRHAFERERHFDRLWLGVEHRPQLARLVGAERDDLRRGDIPLFNTRPDSTDIWTSSGARVEHFFDDPGLELVRGRVRQLGEQDLERQLWFIKASLATLSMSGARWPVYRLSEPDATAGAEELLAAARAVGDRLSRLALRGEAGVSWIGLSYVNERYWSPVALGFDLYNGLPGVALFLAYLGARTREERFDALARETAETISRRLARGKSGVKTVGAFEGWGGWLHTLTHLAALWGEPSLIEEAEAVVESLPALIDEDEHLDVLSGSAGCIVPLLNLQRLAPSRRTLEVAVQCGERLLARAQESGRGVVWLTKAATQRPLAGFSHGAAGISWALLELASVTGREEFRRAAESALGYERGLFSETEGNWPDLRALETPGASGQGDAGNFMIAWCHGAVGIGLSRLCALRHSDDAELRTEIDAALRTTLARGFGHNHSLCHGDLGNLELLLQAGAVLGDAGWRAQAGRMASIILGSIRAHGWLCGIPLGVESPGLMTGLSGIGYGLLRAAEPERVPSLLLLAPPL